MNGFAEVVSLSIKHKRENKLDTGGIVTTIKVKFTRERREGAIERMKRG